MTESFGKFCKDCAWLLPDLAPRVSLVGLKFSRCAKSPVVPDQRYFPVTGVLEMLPTDEHFNYCVTARLSEKDCGPTAKNFEIMNRPEISRTQKGNPTAEQIAEADGEHRAAAMNPKT